ncbi:MAG: ATP-binding protein [Planctomycetota bacterium]
MQTVKVEVQSDHLDRLVQRSTPLHAVAELIWNALDGDADRVDVFVDENGINGIDSIRVVDDGTGIPHDVAMRSFKKLGDSWKKAKRTSADGRALHGEKGEGRFAAFALGTRISWQTCWRDGADTKHYTIVGTHDRLGSFDVGDPQVVKARRTGTEVEISNIATYPRSLLADDVSTRLAERFALYLYRYPDVRIFIQSERIDPSAIQERTSDYELEGLTLESGEPIEASVTIIEWAHKVERELVLCDANGLALITKKAGIQAKGYNFTAYIRSDFLRDNQALLDLDDLKPDLRNLLDAVRGKMRDHFRQRSAEQASLLVERWKEEEVYPYEGAASNPVEAVERQVFDVVALNVHDYLPDFEGFHAKSKRFSFRMLKSAIEKSPSEVSRIIQEVLELPAEKIEDLADLIDRTSLVAIINASRLAVDRLDFLSGLEVMLYHHEAKKHTKERRQLHRVLAENTWIFGEEFNLTVDDRSLNEVLDKHLHLLGRAKQDTAPVKAIDGKSGIVDLMLSKRVPLPKDDEREHLVVELKRPSRKVDAEVIQQVKKYAYAVARDERFRTSEVNWTFWAISNDMDDYARMEASQSARPAGLIHEQENPRIRIWVKTWNQVLDECRARLEFFRRRLEYVATHDAGVGHLQKVYAKYIPPVLKADGK